MTNDFKAVAIGGGANVITQAEWEALTSILANGFTSGVALSARLNKVFRQSSSIAAAVASAMELRTAADVLDNGNITALRDGLLLAIENSARLAAAILIGSAAGTNAKTVAFTDQPYAYRAGQILQFLNTTANTGAVTLNVNGLGAIPVQSNLGIDLVAGDLPAGQYVAVSVQAGATSARLIGLSPSQALTQTAADLRYAKLAGLGTQSFSVGAASLAAHAVRYDQAFGLGQTMQNFTGSRSTGATYTNNTGKPIYLFIDATSSGVGWATLTVAGFAIRSSQVSGSGNPMIFAVIIPNGATYSLAAGLVSSINLWLEFRA